MTRGAFRFIATQPVISGVAALKPPELGLNIVSSDRLGGTSLVFSFFEIYYNKVCYTQKNLSLILVGGACLCLGGILPFGPIDGV